MILIFLTSIFAIAALAMSSMAPSFTGPLLAAAGGTLALSAIGAPHARQHMWQLLRRHAAAAAAFVALAVALAWASGLFGPDWSAAIRQVALLVGLGLAAPATAGLASAYGRNVLALSILLGAIPLAFLALFADGHSLAGPLGRLAPALDAPGLSAGYGLLALLSLHAAADELRRRPAPGEASLPPLARRLFAPLAALMTSFAMLTLAGAAAALGATAVGALVFAGLLWIRARKSRVGAALVPALMFVSVGAAALAVLSASLGLGDRVAAMAARTDVSGAALWLEHAGYLGAGLLAALFAALIIVLAISKDRGRAPSRGAPLLGAFAVYGALLSWFAPGFAAPAAAFLLAVLIGLSLSYVDLGSARKQSPS